MHGIYAMADETLEAARLRAYVIGALSTAAALEREKQRRWDNRETRVRLNDAA